MLLHASVDRLRFLHITSRINCANAPLFRVVAVLAVCITLMRPEAAMSAGTSLLNTLSELNQKLVSTGGELSAETRFIAALNDYFLKRGGSDACGALAPFKIAFI